MSKYVEVRGFITALYAVSFARTAALASAGASAKNSRFNTFSAPAHQVQD